MKKIVFNMAVVLAGIITIATAQAADYWEYSASGAMDKAGHGSDISGIYEYYYPLALDSNYYFDAVVEADHDYFNCKASNSPKGCTVFYNKYGTETLTLGAFDYPLNSFVDSTYHKRKLQECGKDQINYIKSIGGKMTGYNLVTHSDYEYSLNISWDVGKVHHFARFQEVGYAPVGYYDISFESNSPVQQTISHMNKTLVVVGPPC